MRLSRCFQQSKTTSLSNLSPSVKLDHGKFVVEWIVWQAVIHVLRSFRSLSGRSFRSRMSLRNLGDGSLEFLMFHLSFHCLVSYLDLESFLVDSLNSYRDQRSSKPDEFSPATSLCGFAADVVFSFDEFVSWCPIVAVKSSRFPARTI